MHHPVSKNQNPSDQQTVHSSGLVQIRVRNLTPKNKVKTSPILMRELNDKELFELSSPASDLTILKDLSRNLTRGFLQPVSCLAQAARICEKQNL